ncbi:protein kinase domain-containing protein [Nevskia ramosa]|uniref:protein kinase domain-containing protein n=1 Tax=Nevskia ramosa TaxID=64002 RepID=UPI0023564019|nr:protein kinase [Nevskia ramosa]
MHSARWRFGPFDLDETSRELRRGGEAIAIEAKPLNMLMLFLRNPGELVTKDELLDKLWTGRIVSEAVIGNCVTRLRQVLGEEAAGWLRSIHGFGYRFDGPVQLIEDQRATTTAAPKLDFQPGDQPPLRPNWQLLRRLGHSGDSWLAEHSKTRARRVFKFTREATGLSALKREVTVYRLLRESSGEKIFHVDLLDWNFDAPPWFVETEYCPGGSLQEWFETQGGVGKVPLAVRLDLIAQVADALAEVHAVGVLHKDLKPANVFVVMEADGKPSIRLADFGASRLLDPTRLAALEITRLGFTQAIEGDGAASGTPLYLAPELLAGHPATVKADIYALGVMLYQFVIGNLRRQLTPGWEAEVDDEILRSDIAAAAEGNPERRLGDASELARNLRRLQARRVTLEAERAAAENAERAARALERIKARRVGVMAAFAALTMGFATSTYLFLDARKSREHAEQQQRVAVQQSERAEAEARRASAVSDFLARDLFEPLNNGQLPVKNMTVAELLTAGARSVQRRFANDREVAADLHSALGRSFNALEMTEQAEQELELALVAHTEVAGVGDVRAVADAAELATTKFAMGRDDRHLVDYEQIADAATLRNGPLSPDVLRLRTQIAWSRLHRGQLREAASAFRRVYQEQLKADPVDDRAVATAADGLARTLAVYGEYPEAERVVTEGLKHAIRGWGEQHELVGALHATRGLIAGETGHLDLASREYHAALAIAETWGHKDSGTRISAMTGIARTRMRQQRYAESLSIAREAVRDMEAVPSEFDQTAIVRTVIGEALSASGDHTAARRELETALRSATNAYGADHYATRRIRFALVRNARAGRDARGVDQYLGNPKPLEFGDLAPEHSFNKELRALRASTESNPGEVARATEPSAP